MLYLLGIGMFAENSILVALLCFVTGMLVGALLGGVNALFITKTKLPPFIATLGMLSIARGLAEAVTVGWPISVHSTVFRYLGQGFIGFVPVSVIIMIILAIATTFFTQNHYREIRVLHRKQ